MSTRCRVAVVSSAAALGEGLVAAMFAGVQCFGNFLDDPRPEKRRIGIEAYRSDPMFESESRWLEKIFSFEKPQAEGRAGEVADVSEDVGSTTDEPGADDALRGHALTLSVAAPDRTPDRAPDRALGQGFLRWFSKPEQEPERDLVVTFFCLGFDQTENALQQALLDLARNGGLDVIVLRHALHGLERGEDLPESDKDWNDLHIKLARLRGMIRAITPDAQHAPPRVVVALDHALVPASFLSAPIDPLDQLQSLENLREGVIPDFALFPHEPVAYASTGGYKTAILAELVDDLSLGNELMFWAPAGLSLTFVACDRFGIDASRREIASICWLPFEDQTPEDAPTGQTAAVRVSSTLFSPRQTEGDGARSALELRELRQRWQPYRTAEVLQAIIGTALPGAT